MKECSFCKNVLKNKILDLGYSALANAYLKTKKDIVLEKKYPLQLFICDNCKLVQTGVKLSQDKIFQNDYSYLSSTSKTWLNHCENYFNKIKKKLTLNKNSFVLEVASNDGYMLNFFNKAKIPSMGIEPTKSTAAIARQKGIKVLNDFFSYKLAKKVSKKINNIDLIIVNNVIAHVPNLNDFVKGLSFLIRKYECVATIEFQYLKNLVDKTQFDTIYHEHYFYHSLTSIGKILNFHKLKIIDVEQLKTHGGSLRIYVVKNSEKINYNFKSLKYKKLLNLEKKSKLTSINYFKKFQKKTNLSKSIFKQFLINNRSKTIFAYGAAAKGNTFLNFTKVNSKSVKKIFDQSKLKIGKLLPGSHIEIIDPKYIKKYSFDILLIMPWNIKNEIIKKYKKLVSKNVKFISVSKFLKQRT